MEGISNTKTISAVAAVTQHGDDWREHTGYGMGLELTETSRETTIQFEHRDEPKRRQFARARIGICCLGGL